jgi:hypothetical protein
MNITRLVRPFRYAVEAKTRWAALLAVPMLFAGCGSPIRIGDASSPSESKTASLSATPSATAAPTPTAAHGTYTLALGSTWAGPAALLQSGDVLVFDSQGQLQLYTPSNGRLENTGASPAPDISVAWSGLLRDGRVLFIGEAGPLPYREVAVVYDPATGRWNAAGSDPLAREFAAFARLRDGRVLIVGGHGGEPDAVLKSAQIYDPATGKFSATGSMSVGRSGPAATALPDGRVLVAGGAGETSSDDPYENVLASAEIYDPAKGEFVKAGSMATPRVDHEAVLLQDGRVLVVGGNRSRDTNLASAEIYDPATSKFTPTGSMSVERYEHAVVLLSSGKVLVAGGSNFDGEDFASSELYDPATGKFGPTGAMTTARAFPTAVRLTDGRVLIAGGGNSQGNVNSAEIYWP